MSTGDPEHTLMATTLSAFIKRDLRDRLRAGLGPPTDLTIPALAEHYRVSFTPVREALRELIAEGMLRKQDNGRMAIGPARRTARAAEKASPLPAPSPPPNPSADLESALAAEVLARSLRRDSDYLREEATARRFGVGRTAIRQAFGRLAGRGLLVHVPRCGWRVRPFDDAELDAYLDIRELMELKALDLARPRLDPDDLRRMLAGNAEEDGAQPHLDNDLHRYLVEKSGNPYIRDFFDRNGPYFTALLDFAAPETRVVDEMAHQHRDILQALIDRDWSAARAALARHIRAQRPIVRDLMARIARENTPES